MYPSQTSNSLDARQALVIATILDDLIGDCDSRSLTGLILRRARGEILGLLSSNEQLISRSESLSG
jgi:hypothetical protein